MYTTSGTYCIINDIFKKNLHAALMLYLPHGTYIRWYLRNGAHIWSKLGISICWRHLVTSTVSSNSIFFLRKRSILLHTCSKLPSYISTMISLDSSLKVILIFDLFLIVIVRFKLTAFYVKCPYLHNTPVADSWHQVLLSRIHS